MMAASENSEVVDILLMSVISMTFVEEARRKRKFDCFKYVEIRERGVLYLCFLFWRKTCFVGKGVERRVRVRMRER